MPGPTAIKTPLECPPRIVEPQWIDGNGHLNMAYYNLLFDEALDAVFTGLGVGWEYTQKGTGSFFTAEIHVTYVQELKEGDPVRITYQLLDWDEKRMHLFAHMYHGTEGYLAATSEQMCIHVSLETRKTGPMPPDAQARLKSTYETHQTLPKPDQVGSTIGIRRKKATA